MPLLQPFDNNIRLIEKSLDLRSKNQQIISANIANAETPGYSPARFSFQEDLEQALKTSKAGLQTSHEKHISFSAPDFQAVNGNITTQPDMHSLGDENGVSVDDEMLALSENQLLYEVSAQIIKKKIGMVKYAVSGGQ